MFYTGVGSRETPAEVLDLMRELARDLGTRGWVLRSGAADGADSAFEDGAPANRRHIYLPWVGFNQRHSGMRLSRATADAYTMASRVHVVWDILSPAARSLHARNCHQVLGDDLKTPSIFLVCWTSDGCTCKATRTRWTGGTATAIVLAEQHGVPVFNLRNEGTMSALREFVEEWEEL